MKAIGRLDRRKLAFIINRLLLILAGLVVLAVLFQPQWRAEFLKQWQTVLIHARLL